MAATYYAKLWDNTGVDIAPTGQTLDGIEAESEKEAARVAARKWGLAPYEWCFDSSPYEIETGAES